MNHHNQNFLTSLRKTGQSFIAMTVAALCFSVAVSGVAITTWGVAYAADSSATVPHSDTVGAALGDTGITTAVKAKYLGNERVKGADISVTTTNGVVTLTGKAPSAEVRAAAEEIAQATDGVKSVDNQIDAPGLIDKAGAKTKQAVKKSERVVSDSWITTKVKSRLLADSLTKGFKISVKTQNGVVKLAGNVDTQNTADRAADLAREITGVKSVDASGIVVKSE